MIFKVPSNPIILWFCDNPVKPLVQMSFSESCHANHEVSASPHSTPQGVPHPSHHCPASSPGADGSRAVDAGFAQKVWITALRSLFQPLSTAPVLREASCSGFELRAASQSACALCPCRLQGTSTLVWGMEGLREWMGKLQERRWNVSPKITE